MLLFQQPYQSTNYNHEEIEATLENSDKNIRFILANWKTKSIGQLAKEFGVTKGTIGRWVRGKAKKKKYVVPYRTAPITNLILNTETGIYYNSFSSAGKSVGVCRQTMRDNIRGVSKIPGFKHWKIV